MPDTPDGVLADLARLLRIEDAFEESHRDAIVDATRERADRRTLHRPRLTRSGNVRECVRVKLREGRHDLRNSARACVTDAGDDPKRANMRD
jgi:hypothetical protein